MRSAPKIESEDCEGDSRQRPDCSLILVGEISDTSADQTRSEIKLRDLGDGIGITFVKFLILRGVLVAVYTAFKRFGWIDYDDQSKKCRPSKGSPTRSPTTTIRAISMAWRFQTSSRFTRRCRRRGVRSIPWDSRRTGSGGHDTLPRQHAKAAKSDGVNARAAKERRLPSFTFAGASSNIKDLVARSMPVVPGLSTRAPHLRGSSFTRAAAAKCHTAHTMETISLSAESASTMRALGASSRRTRR